MTDAGIPMGEGQEQRAREVLANLLAADGRKTYAQIIREHGFVAHDKLDGPLVLKAMLAFADTPPPAAAGDRAANTIDPKVAARDLVLNANRVSEILNKPIKMDLSDTEHAELDRLENEVTELRHFVRRQLREHFGVTWEELEQAL
jgi:hypothetical protein